MIAVSIVKHQGKPDSRLSEQCDAMRANIHNAIWKWQDSD